MKFRTRRAARLHCVGLLLLAHAAAAGLQAQQLAPDLRVHVRTQAAALRSEPNLGAQLLDALPYGTELRQLNVRGHWYEVEALATGNRGWIHKDDAAAESPVLPDGYAQLRWGASAEEVQQATGSAREGERLVEQRAAGPIAAVAYNFHQGRLWFVEERYRLPAGRGIEDVVQLARQRFGKPHAEATRRWSRPRDATSGQETLMETRIFRWNTGPTGFALISYGPLYEEGAPEVHAEYWSEAIAAEAGYGGPVDVLDGLDFGGARP
jgi:hypothetical protein